MRGRGATGSSEVLARIAFRIPARDKSPVIFEEAGRSMTYPVKRGGRSPCRRVLVLKRYARGTSSKAAVSIDNFHPGLVQPELPVADLRVAPDAPDLDRGCLSGQEPDDDVHEPTDCQPGHERHLGTSAPSTISRRVNPRGSDRSTRLSCPAGSTPVHTSGQPIASRTKIGSTVNCLGTAEAFEDSRIEGFFWHGLRSGEGTKQEWNDLRIHRRHLLCQHRAPRGAVTGVLRLRDR